MQCGAVVLHCVRVAVLRCGVVLPLARVMHRYLEEAGPQSYRSYADIESSGVYVNIATVIAGLVAATTLVLRRFERAKTSRLSATPADGQLLFPAASDGDGHLVSSHTDCGD